MRRDGLRKEKFSRHLNELSTSWLFYTVSPTTLEKSDHSLSQFSEKKALHLWIFLMKILWGMRYPVLCTSMFFLSLFLSFFTSIFFSIPFITQKIYHAICIMLFCIINFSSSSFLLSILFFCVNFPELNFVKMHSESFHELKAH